MTRPALTLLLVPFPLPFTSRPQHPFPTSLTLWFSTAHIRGGLHHLSTRQLPKLRGTMGDQGDSYTASIDGSRHDEDEITSRGDLTLVIGKEKVRLRVHSAVMRDGSPVFDEWLGCTPGWGPMILKENPRELSLEDDDPEAIRLLCSILHCTITASPPAPTSILRLAEAALRYDSVSKVSLTVRVWYNKLASSQEEVDELWPLLLAADILHLDDFFADVSLQLLLKHSGSFQNLTRRGELGNAATCCKRPHCPIIRMKKPPRLTYLLQWLWKRPGPMFECSSWTRFHGRMRRLAHVFVPSSFTDNPSMCSWMNSPIP